MESYFILFCFLIYFVNTALGNVSQTVSNGARIKSLPTIDALITSLEEERWSPSEEACQQATLDMLRGVKNNTLWATWVWDSMQPPVGTLYGERFHLGNYDQCLQMPWLSRRDQGANPGLQTQYCIVDVKSIAVEEIREIDLFESAEEYYRTPTQEWSFNEHSFGVCLPAVCNPPSVARIFRRMHQLTHLPDGDVFVDPRDCQKAGEPMEYSRGFYIFWSLVGVLMATTAFATIFNNNNTHQTSLDFIRKSFCLKRNYSSLFEVNGDDIPVMNGMRFLTATLIVGLHEGVLAFLMPVVNCLFMEETVSSTNGLVISHLEIGVDTFFAMSGLLLVRGLMLGKQKNILYVLVKRYIRLIGPFALSTLYLATAAATSMGDGPLWRRFYRAETDACAENWWRNLLMINTDAATLCHIVSWYVSCDFQLAILAACLFWLFRRNRKLGVSAFVAVAVGLTLNLGWLVYSKELDILPLRLKLFFAFRKATVLNYTYLTSYSRAGSYLVGMAMGYIVSTYKPGNYRNIISKKWSYVTALASLATMATMLSIGAIFAGRTYDPLEAAVAVATNRVLWAVAVCCLIGVCEYGSVALITNLLGWPGFVPLSKLSYGLYLLHPFILYQQKCSARTPVTYGLYTMVVNSQGVVVVGCAASFVLYLILEAPLINMSNALFAEKSFSKSSQQSGKENTNKKGNGVIPEKNELDGYTKDKTS